MKYLILIFLLISTFSYAETPNEINMPDETQEKVIELCKNDLANYLGVEKGDIRTKSIVEVTWANTSLGFPEKGQTYYKVLMYGYKIVLSCKGKDYEYHTSQNIIKLDPKVKNYLTH